jgi:GNAT superfamily N-acetyltransferase
MSVGRDDVREAGTLRIREAVRGDAALVLSFIQALAEYEKLRDACVATVEDIDRSLFGPDAVPRVLIAEWDGEAVGFALWCRNYSTFLARPGIWLEDLFVRPEARGRGVGKALLAELARIAVDRGYGRVEWSVLDWNAPSIAFYRSLGATAMDEWTVFRLTGDAMRELGATAAASTR